jgi:hypothetical protein
MIAESLVHALIEQNPHLGFGGEKLVGLIERRYGHFAGH